MIFVHNFNILKIQGKRMIARLYKSVKYLLLLGLCTACTTKENFPDMGTNFNGVVSIKDITIDGSKYMIALSSDYDRTYNKGLSSFNC